MCYNATALIFAPPRYGSGVLRSVGLSLCVSVCARAYYLWKRWTDLHEIFLCGSPVAVTRSSSGGVAIRYVLPVLWMTSRLAVMGRLATSGVAIPGRSLMSMKLNALFYNFIADENLEVKARLLVPFVGIDYV